jgi:hypothetical protein
MASKVGEPVLVDPTPMSATDVTKDATQALLGKSAVGDNNAVSVETVKSGTPPPSEDAPRSTPPPPDAGTAPAGSAPGVSGGELQPTAQADSNELKVDTPQTDETGATVQPPAQINELQNGAAADPNAATTPSSSTTSASSDASSSKPKKKKGLHKVIPF